MKRKHLLLKEAVCKTEYRLIKLFVNKVYHKRKFYGWQLKYAWKKSESTINNLVNHLISVVQRVESSTNWIDTPI